MGLRGRERDRFLSWPLGRELRADGGYAGALTTEDADDDGTEEEESWLQWGAKSEDGNIRGDQKWKHKSKANVAVAENSKVKASVRCELEITTS